MQAISIKHKGIVSSEDYTEVKVGDEVVTKVNVVSNGNTTTMTRQAEI